LYIEYYKVNYTKPQKKINRQKERTELFRFNTFSLSLEDDDPVGPC